MRKRDVSLGPPLLLAMLAACGGNPDHLDHLFPGPPAEAEIVETLDAFPSALSILPDGRWAASAGEERAAPAAVPYRLDGNVLLIASAGGRFDARVENVLRGDGRPRVTFREEPGVVAAAVLRGSLRPGTSVVAVRLRDGRTWTVGSWDMTGSDGHLDVDEMRLSPGGAWLACQLREMHPAGGGSVREVGTRGIVIPLGDGDEAIVDLGPGIRGSMRWAPDGGFLYFLRPRRGEGATLLRVEFPASRAPANPRLQWPDGAPQAGGPRAWPPRPAEAATPSRAFSRDDLVAAIIRLSADDRATRLTAAAELESMPDPMAVGPLVTALEAGDPALCTAASRTLQILLPHPSPPRPASGDKEACATAAAAWRTWLIDHPTSLGAKHEN